MGYRHFVKDQARKLGLSGWVRNESDGSVRIEVEGEPGPLESLKRSCHQGPIMAKVTDVTCTELPLQGESGFDVLR